MQSATATSAKEASMNELAEVIRLSAQAALDTPTERTAKNLYPEIKPDRTGIAHNALDDALTQANHLIAIATARRTAP